jgi:ketosteroid isomerase-like protein
MTNGQIIGRLHEAFARGDTVVALGRYSATHKVTGQPDGKVVSFQQYTDTPQFARVAGALAV